MKGERLRVRDRERKMNGREWIIALLFDVAVIDVRRRESKFFHFTFKSNVHTLSTLITHQDFGWNYKGGQSLQWKSKEEKSKRVTQSEPIVSVYLRRIT